MIHGLSVHNNKRKEDYTPFNCIYNPICGILCPDNEYYRKVEGPKAKLYSEYVLRRMLDTKYKNKNCQFGLIKNFIKYYLKGFNPKNSHNKYKVFMNPLDLVKLVNTKFFRNDMRRTIKFLNYIFVKKRYIFKYDGYVIFYIVSFLYNICFE